MKGIGNLAAREWLGVACGVFLALLGLAMVAYSLYSLFAGRWLLP